LLAQPAAGRIEYHVSPTGSDTNPGTSAAPFRTINKAAQVALAGDVVTIRDGTYNESVTVRNSGAIDKRIVFQAQNRGKVVLSGGRHVFQPAGWVGGKMTSGAFHVTVRGLVFRQYGDPLAGHVLRSGKGWTVHGSRNGCGRKESKP
jgi:hypothetical protein